MIIDILKELSAINSAPGADAELLSYIEKKYGKYCDSVKRDGVGNLLLIKKGSGGKSEKLMLTAASTGCGCIVNYIEENGYIRITKLGNAGSYCAVYSEVVFENGTRGFVLPEMGAEIKDVDFSKLYVDIGAKSREEAEKCVKLGDVCAFPSRITSLCTDRVCISGSSAILGMAILIEVLTEISDCTLQNDIVFAFNIQDAPRNLSAKVSAYTAQCDKFILADVCDSFDVQGANRRGEAVLGDGAVIIAKSADHCANPEMRAELEGICEKDNIKHKTCVYADMTTQAGNVAKSGKGAAGLAVCVPVRNRLGTAQIFEISDAECVKKLILSYTGR